MKRLLNSISTKQEKTDESENKASSRKSSREGSSLTLRVYEAECIFCYKANKFLRGRKTRKSLVQWQELTADASIINAAMKKIDGRLLTIISRDLVAAEKHNRRLSYRSYAREEKAACSAIHDEDHNDEAHYARAPSHSYNEVFLFIRNELFTNPQVIAIADLAFKLVTSM